MTLAFSLMYQFVPFVSAALSGQEADRSLEKSACILP